MTPFSPRAIDRGLAGVAVAIARHGLTELTAPLGAGHAGKLRTKLGFVTEALAVLVAGLAVYQGLQVFEELGRRMEERADLRVDMYLNVERKYGDTTAKEELLAAFARRFRREVWPGGRIPNVFYDARSLAPSDKKKKRASLHAKCVVVDMEHVLVTSANFTAQERNIEVGILVRDPTIAEQLRFQFEALVEQGSLLRARDI